MLLLNPIAIFCALLSLASAAPAPTPQANVDVFQARQVTRAKIAQLAARDPVRRATASSLPPINKLFRIRFDAVDFPNSRDGTYASDPSGPLYYYVEPGRTFAAAGLFYLDSAGQLTSAANSNIAYGSPARDGYVSFAPAPATQYPAPIKCQIDSSNILTCVKTLDPPAGSATYICNQVLAYGVCQQGGGVGGPLETTTAVFV